MSEINIEVKVTSNIDKNKLLEHGDKTKFFKDRMHELAFYFSMSTKMTDFDDDLHIKRVHIKDIKKARELRNMYLSIFHPDKNKESFEGLDFTEISQDIKDTFYRVSGGKL